MSSVFVKKSASLRVKFFSVLLFFCLLYGLGLFFGFRSIRALQRYAAATPVLVEGMSQLNAHDALLERVEAQLVDIFIANYPERRSALYESLDALEMGDAAMSANVEAMGLEVADDVLTAHADAVAKLRAAIRGLAAADFSGKSVNSLTAETYAAIDSLARSHDMLAVAIRNKAESVSGERARTLGRLLLELTLVAAAMALTFVGFALLLSRVIMRPVRKLMIAAEELRRGEFGRKSGVESSDELGRLAAIIDDASESLGKKSVIERRSRELESQLKERAAALERKVRELEIVNAATIDRELKMVELKKKIARLERGRNII